MLKAKKYLFSTAAIMVLSIFVGACDTGPAASLYEGDPTFSPDPVIASVDPPLSALAGVEEVTITGSNFSPVPVENLVYFGSTRVTVLEASATMLKVVPPPVPAEDVTLRVSVVGAENFSNSVSYTLDPAATTIGDIQGFEELFGIATDPTGNVYASLFVNSLSVGIKIFAPDGTRSDFAESTFKWDGLQVADDGSVIAVRNLRAIFRFQAGGAQETWAVISDTAVRLIALDFDSSGNLWTGGSRSNEDTPISIFKVDATQQVTPYTLGTFSNAARVTALTVGGGVLYAAISDGDSTGLWKFNISTGDLGSPELVLDFSTEVDAQANIRSLAVAASGDLYAGTTLDDPIIVVESDGSWSPLYPGILEPSGASLAWGPEGILYMVKGKTIIPGSSELTDADLYKIEIGQEGIR